jgi:hypothetical protein
MADRSSADTTEVEARDRAIVDRVAAGQSSLKEIGAEFGVSGERVRKIAIRAGVRSQLTSARHSPWTPERDAMLRRLRAEGLTVPEIASRVGMSTTATQDRILKLKVPWIKRWRERNHSIIERVGAGASLAATAREFGLSHACIGKISKAAGVRSRSTVRPIGWTVARNATLRALRLEGQTWAVIGQRLGVSGGAAQAQFSRLAQGRRSRARAAGPKDKIFPAVF